MLLHFFKRVHRSDTTMVSTTVAILVNSCVSYFRSTLPPLLRSLHVAGVDPADVFVIVGDATESITGGQGPAAKPVAGYMHVEECNNKYRFWFVPWSNIDDNALIWAVTAEGREALRDREWIFYIHDTTTVMPKFGADVLARVPTSPVPALPLKRFPAMSMGYYRLQDLWAAGDAVLAKRNDDTSEQGRARAKNAPGLEDGVFRLLLGRDQVAYPADALNPEGCEAVHVDRSPYDGVQRIRETWDVPGLYKFKANWGQSHQWGVSL